MLLILADIIYDKDDICGEERKNFWLENGKCCEILKKLEENGMSPPDYRIKRDSGYTQSFDYHETVKGEWEDE